jgi:RNA polymerase sigma factor (sigma-70 family)
LSVETMDATDNSELVRAAQRGDRQAFGALVERYQGMVYGICLRMTADSFEAEDLAHDAFIDAFLKIGQLEEIERFPGWLRTLTLNVCRMWLRTKKGAWAEGIEELATASKGDEAALSGRLIRGLGRLRPEQRMMLVLHYWEGVSYEEAAEFLDVPIGTVMSRLHRSRQALKDIVNDFKEDEEEMAPDEEFGRTVEAEIEVLLKMFREKPESMERLEQILEHAPERFVQLVAEMEEELIEPLVLLLKRLGKPAVDVLLKCFFEAEDQQTRTHALTLLRELLATARRRPPGEEAEEGNVPRGREAYFLLDRLFQADWEEQIRVELLLELLEACHDEDRKLFPDESEETLLVHAVLCYAERSFPLLMERFWNMTDRGELHEQAWILYALKRTGPRFGWALLEGLEGEDGRRLELALAGLEVLLPWPNGEWFDEWPALQQRLELRFRSKLAPVTAEQMNGDPTLREELAERLVPLLEHAEGEVRNLAISLLGALESPGYFSKIRVLAEHADITTRLAVLRALSNALDGESLELFTRAAREGEAAEQRIAAEALGRLGAEEALPLLIELADGGKGQVREAAVIAMGEIGGDRAREALERLVRAKDRKLVKVAGSALYGGGDKNFKFEKQDEEPTVRQKLSARRLAKVRGDAQPFLYHVTTAAVCVLPEIKPYSEPDLTYYIAQVEHDFAHTRRHLVVKRIMRRADRTYELTEMGEAMWRVERFIAEHYLNGEWSRNRAG